jgi:hypothetical protein
MFPNCTRCLAFLKLNNHKNEVAKLGFHTSVSEVDTVMDTIVHWANQGQSPAKMHNGPLHLISAYEKP